jgi:hypothetical protein
MRRILRTPNRRDTETEEASSADEAFFLTQQLPTETYADLYLELYTLKDEPQPQVLFTFGFSNLKPAPSSVST